MADQNKSRELHWRGILKQQSSSGLSIAAFCRQKSITQTSFYTWQRKFREQKAARDKGGRSTKSARTGGNAGRGTQLLPVRIEGTTPAPTLRVHLPQQGVLVEIPHGTDHETMTCVLRALREVAPC